MTTKKERKNRFSFTQKRIQEIKAAPAGKRSNFYDTACKGLMLRVSDRGIKSFIFGYTFKGKEERLLLGHWGDIDLDAARALKGNHEATIYKKDQNPAETIRHERALRLESNGVEVVIERWLDEEIRTLRKKWKECQRQMTANVLPLLKEKRIVEVTETDIHRILNKMKQRGARVSANRCLTILKAWLKWCVKHKLIAVSPAENIDPPTREVTRDRVLEDSELAEILAATQQLSDVYGPYFRFLMLVGQRLTETATMRWRHIDLKAGTWIIPAGNTKAGRTHVVPLSQQARALLERLTRGEKGDYVWSTRDGKQPINGFSRMKEQIDRLTMQKRKEADIEENIPGWSPHDLRRTIRTYFGRTHVPMIVGEGILNHAVSSSRSKLEEIYDRYEYIDEKRIALQGWADHLDLCIKK